MVDAWLNYDKKTYGYILKNHENKRIAIQANLKDNSIIHYAAKQISGDIVYEVKRSSFYLTNKIM